MATDGKVEKVRRARTCVACGATSTKGDLVRFVRMSDGTVAIDERGKANGRGAYLCPKRECFAAARKRNRIAAALKTSVSQDVYDQLEKDFDRLCAQNGDAQE